MTWLIKLLTSNLGKKYIVSLTGLFIISFLLVHLLGNLSLMKDDGGVAFNEYAHFMTNFLPVTIISWGLYFFIVLHAIQGLLLWNQNRKAKGIKPAVNSRANKESWASTNMALLGTLILAFLFIHMGDFWVKMKFTHQLDVPGTEVKDLYTRVSAAFSVWWIVLAYVIGQIVLAFHLWHGFGSAFQTLGVNHKNYTPMINMFGKAFAIIVPLGFAIIPLYVYFMR